MKSRGRPLVYQWSPEQDTKLGTTMCQAVIRNKNIMKTLVQLALQLDIPVSIVRHRWYTVVKPAVANEYERAVNSAKLTPNKAVVVPLREAETSAQPKAEATKVEEPTEQPAPEERMSGVLLASLQGNKAVYAALTLLIQRYAKMELDNTALKRKVHNRDKTIQSLEEEREKLNERLHMYREIRNSR